MYARAQAVALHFFRRLHEIFCLLAAQPVLHGAPSWLRCPLVIVKFAYDPSGVTVILAMLTKDAVSQHVRHCV
jgi:hypothetical protein